MAFQPVEDTAEVILSGTVLGKVWANQLFFENSLGWTLLDLNTLAQDVANWWSANIRPACSVQTILTKVVATDLSTQFGLQAELAALIPGTVNLEAVPNNVSMVISFYTGVRGRAFRGRNFVPGAVESYISGNAFTGDYVDTIRDGYAELPAAISLASVDHVVVSRQVNGVVLSEGIATDVIDYRTDGKVHSMRRRLD